MSPRERRDTFVAVVALLALIALGGLAIAALLPYESLQPPNLR